MRFRLNAFALHLIGSSCVLSLVLGSLWLGWYRWPGWYLANASHIVGLLILIDLAVGPCLTLIVANPAKPRRELARDIGVIVCVQVAALIYGATTLWSGRPLYYTFSFDRLEIVQASDIKPDEFVLASERNPSFAPHWYSLPRWIWAPVPDGEEGARIATGVLFGGTDIIDMPRFFKPWEKGLPRLREELVRLDDMKYLTKPEKQSLRARMSKRGLAADERNTMIMWGGTRRLLAVFDPATLHIVAILRA
jgi:hypothetical protein